MINGSTITAHRFCECRTFEQPRSIAERVALAATAVFCFVASTTSAVFTPFVPGALFSTITFGALGLLAANAAFSNRTVEHYCNDHRPMFFVDRSPVYVTRRPWYRPALFTPVRTKRPVFVGTHRPPVYHDKRPAAAHRPPVHPAAHPPHTTPGVRR